MAISDIVNITISVATAGVARAGFGIPLILSGTANWVERVRFYTSLSGVAADFAATTGEYLMAQALFSQRPFRPRRIAIGRLALPPTLRYDFSVATVTNSKTYAVEIDGVTIDYDADSSTSAVEIVTGLAAAINSETTGITASVVNTDHLQVVADTAGAWFSMRALDESGVLGSDLKGGMNHADPGVATDLGNIALEDSTWYYVLNPYDSEAMANALAAHVETTTKLYVCGTSATECATVATGSATDIAEDLKDAAYARTACVFHPQPDNFNAAAWVGAMASRDPGSATWQFKTLTGVTAEPMTETMRTNLLAKKCNWYEDLGGVSGMQGGGIVSGGEYLDVVIGLDWFQARLGERIVNLLLNADKVPYENEGISLIQAQLDAQLKEAERQKVFATNSSTSSVPDAEDVDESDRDARHLPNIEFTARLSGAIHTVDVTGTVTA